MSKKSILFIWVFLYLNYSALSQGLDYPNEHWLKYEQPVEAGFDQLQLAELKRQFEEQGGSTLFVVHGGKVAISWGDPHRRFLQASIRKSYLSALFGIFANEGLIDLTHNLAKLQVDDIHVLTEKEKEATVIDLLRARSGIYLPAAYSPRGMAKYLPARGSHAPGTFWYYNNWDFNALSTIFHQQTQQDLFTSFQERIAKSLQMEDFRLSDTYYRYEKDKSMHPAYLFKMSARDMARFGLLFLRKGKWKDQQVVPGDWVAESTRVHSSELRPNFEKRGGYGLLWWVAPPIAGNRVYYAAGSGGQRIFVIPEQDMVVVHLVDTYQNQNVGQEAIQSLLERLLAAKTKEATPKATLTLLNPPKSPQKRALDLTFAQEISGDYFHPFLKKLSIVLEEETLFLQTGVGKFKLFPTGNQQYLIEDIQFPIVFEQGTTEQKGKSQSVINEQRMVERVIFYY